MTDDSIEPLIPPRKPNELARECPVNIHLSGADGGGFGQTYWPWAYRMNRAQEAGVSDTYVDSSDVFILDSAIDDPEISNEDVMEDATSYDIDYVIAADVLHDPETTTERVLEFQNMVDDADTSADTIVPLQPTDEHAADHGDHYLELEGVADYYAVGGVKDAPAAVKRDSVESVRDIDPDVTLHGFGFGIGYFADPRVLKDPLLDSIDCTTPLQAARNGEMYVFENGRLVKREVPRPSGDLVALQQAILSGSTLISMCRLVMEANLDPQELRDLGQSGIEEFGIAADGGPR